MNRLHFLLTIIILAAVSCQKDDFPPVEEEDEHDSATCKISKIVYYDGLSHNGLLRDSAIYTWAGDDLERVTWQDGFAFDSLFYNNGLCTTMKLYDYNGSSLYAVYLYEYNPDKSFKRSIRYDFPDAFGQHVRRTIDFQYNNGKMNRLMDSIAVYLNGSLDQWRVDTLDLQYMGNNVTKILRKQGNGYTVEIDYKYDTNSNYFAPMARNSFLTDYHFGFGVGESWDEHGLAIYNSSNNIVESSVRGDTETWSYELDSLQRLSVFKMNNVLTQKYYYSCN